MAGNPFHGDVSGKHHEGKAEPPLSLLGFRHKGGPTEALKRGVIALIPAACSTPQQQILLPGTTTSEQGAEERLKSGLGITVGLDIYL